MEKTENPENSGVSESTEGETTPEEGDVAEENPVDNNTPVIDEPAGEESDEGEDTSDVIEAGSDEELTEETQPVEDETASENEEESDTSDVNDSEVNAVIPTETEIGVVQYWKGGTPAEGSTPAQDKLLDGDAAAEVTFVDGTSADDSKALGGNRPVKFRVDAKDGWKTAGLKVEASIAPATGEATFSELRATEGVYTINTNVAATTGEDAKPAGYSGNITIKITAEPVKSTVILNEAPASSVKVYLASNGAPETTKPVTASVGQELDYEAATGDVTLAVSGLTKTYNSIDVWVAGETKTISTSGTTEVDQDGVKVKYHLFAFNPSELEGFDKNADNDVHVTVGAGEEAHALSVVLGSGSEWTASKIAIADTEEEKYYTLDDEGTAFVGVSDLNEENYESVNTGTEAAPVNKKRVLAFKVTPNKEAGWKLKGENPVTAVLTADEGDDTAVQTLNATFVPAVTGDNPVEAYYKIDLSQLTKTNFTGAMTLTVKAETEADSNEKGVHTISFAGDDLKNVALGKKVGSSFEKLTSPYTAKMDAITFGVKPNTGYSLKKGTDYNNDGNYDKEIVAVTYDKVYDLKTKAEGDTAAADVTVTIPVSEELVVTADGDDADYLAANIAFTGEDADWKGKLPEGTTADKIDVGSDNSTGNMAYTKKNIVVTVETVLSSGLSGTVTIESGGMEYTVSGEGISETSRNKYKISEEAELLILTITSDVEPSVGYCYGGESAEVKKGETEGTFVAEIPVGELSKYGEAIDDTIYISKGWKSLEVWSKTDDEEGFDSYFGGNIEVNGRPFENISDDGFVAGQKIDVTLTAPQGTEFVSVAKVVGEDGEEEAVEVGEDKGSVTFSVTMTDDVNVYVTLKRVYDAVVEVGGKEAERGDDGVYIIPTGSKNIKVSLFKGEYSEDILYAKVYDGNEIAVTTATIAANVATISEISDKDTGVLRVDLASKETNKVEASVEIKQEQAASELAIKDEKNKEVSSVSLMADSKAEFTVSAASGRLDYAKENIGVEVVAKADDAPAATPADNNEFVTAAYADGKLTITAKPAKEGKEAAAVIRFYDKAKRAAATGDTDKICLMAPAITVNTTNPSVVGQKPVVKEATGTDKTLKVELSTTDKVVKPASNKVFYKVTIEGTLAGTLTDADKTQYFEKTKWGKDSQIEEIVVDNTPDKDAQGNLQEGSAKDYALKVELVQTTTAKSAKEEEAANTLALGGQVAELKKISTRNPLYETKLKMKPASVTVYTQQTLDKVEKPQTQAQFDKKTGYTVVPYVQFVNTKTGVLLGEASNPKDSDSIAYYNDVWEAKVDPNGNVYIGYSGGSTAAKYQPKDIGLKVTAEYPAGSYAATAIVKINVVNGIENIDFVSGDYRSIYKKSGKPASLKFTPILNGGSKDQAPKKKTLTFAMGDADGDLPKYGGRINAEVASKVKVNPKNGAVTVDKSYDVAKGDTFTVVAQAADYEGNNITGVVTVDITDQAQELGEVVIVEEEYDWDDYRNEYKVVARSGGTLNAEDFFTTDEYEDYVYEKNLYVRALKPNAGTKSVYTDDDFVYGVTYASSVKAALGVETAWGRLDFIKPNAKPVKLTITPADGSGTKGKKDMSVTVKGFEKLGLEMYDSNGTHYDSRVTKHTYDGALNERFTLTAVAELWDDDYRDCSSLGYTNLTISAKGAKITSKSSNGCWMSIVMTAPTATITIADKTDKTVKRIYTITQDPAAPAKAKAPSIKQIGKLTAADMEAVRNYDMDGEDLVKFQVTNKNTDPANNARQYVFLTPDYTKTKLVNGRVEYRRANEYFLNYNDTVIKQIDDNGRFALDLNVAGNETFETVPGTYTLIATVGNYSDGKFVPAAKGVNLKINIPGKAAKNSLTVKGKYTLDASAMAPVDLASGNNIVTDYNWTLTNAVTNGNYAMNKIDPKTGKANNFTTYFEVKYMDGTFKLGLKPNLTKAQIDYITGQVKETAKDAKADCEGYVTVSSYMYYEDEHEITKDMKITVSFKDVKYAAKTVEPSVYVGADATVQIFETAKSTDPIALAGAFIVADDKNGGATLVNTTSGVEADNESLKVKFGSAEAGKSYKVTFKVLAADSAYANMTAEGAKDYKKLAEDYGRTVTATIKVSDKGDKTKNKVAVTGKAFKFTADDFTDATANTYLLDVAVRNAIEGTDIAEAKVADKVKDKDYEGKDIVSAAYKDGKVTLTLKRDKLIEANAVKTSKFKFNKSVDVPVEFTFKDTAVTKATVNLKVTLPNPMTFEKAVEAAKKLEPVIGGMKDDKLFTGNAGMMADLEARINAAINSALPKDVQAVVPRPVRLTQDTKDGAEIYKTTVTVQKAATKAEGDYEHEYTFAKAEAIPTTAWELKSVIEDLSAEDFAQLGNDYTTGMLLEDVKSALAKQGIKIPVNLSLSVDEASFTVKKATADRDGYLRANIKIRDRRDSGSYTAGIDVVIPELGDLRDNGRDVRIAVEKVKTKDSEDGINYAGIMAADSGIEEALKTAIVTAANGAIRNPEISTNGFEKIDASANGDNPKKTETDKKVDVDFKKPVSGAEPGWVKFTLLLHQDGMKDYRVACNITVRMPLQSKIDKIIKDYTGALNSMDGVQTVYDPAARKFTVTLDESKKDANIEQAFRDWKADKVTEERKEKLINTIEAELESEWNELESVTLTANGSVKAQIQQGNTTVTAEKLIDQTKIVEKKSNEDIRTFAERIYQKLEENQEDYIARIKEELKKHNVSEDPTFGMIGDASGTMAVRINYTGSRYDEQQYTMSLAGLAK